MTEFYWTEMLNKHWNPYHIVRNNNVFLLSRNMIQDVSYFQNIEIKKHLLIIYD